MTLFAFDRAPRSEPPKLLAQTLHMQPERGSCAVGNYFKILAVTEWINPMFTEGSVFRPP
ncbi:hypothetical protein [Bradyrhizobium sp. USDA 4508]